MYNFQCLAISEKYTYVYTRIVNGNHKNYKM